MTHYLISTTFGVIFIQLKTLNNRVVDLIEQNYIVFFINCTFFTH